MIAFCVLLTCALVLLFIYTKKRKLQTRARAKTNIEAKAKLRRGLSVRPFDMRRFFLSVRSSNLLSSNSVLDLVLKLR